MRKLILALVGALVVAVVALAIVYLPDGKNGGPAPSPTNVVSAPSATPEPVDADAVWVYPAPGVVSASAETQFSFRNVAPSKIGDVEVTGSESGGHTGELEPHSDGKGASFVMDKRFKAGETVEVKTGLKIAGTEDGDFKVTIAVPSKERKIRPQEPVDKGKGKTLEFASRPDLVPPAVTITTSKAGHEDSGDIFLAPKGGRGQEGVMLVDDKGGLVYFKPMPKDRIATDFRTQTYAGKPVLTWWQGGLITGDGRGYGVIYDSHYKKVKTVHAGNGYSMDLHEFTLTPQGTALVMAYDRVTMDLTELGGPKGASVVGAVVQEIDVKTGLVLFEWHSIGSIGLDESKANLPAKAGGEYDYMHLNSIDLTKDGDFILSARNTWGIYKVDRPTARVQWRLGGTKSDFKMGEGTTTAWQHHARVLPSGDLEIFDNGASPPVHKASRAIELKLDERGKTVKLVHAFTHPENVLAATQGSAEPLENGDIFVGFGSQKYFGEFDPKGKLVFGGELARGNDSYRAFRLPWKGRPSAPPDLKATRSGGRLTVHASYNGATGIARWELLAGPRKNALKRVTSAKATGFETTLKSSSGQRYVAVRALDGDGKKLGTSESVKVD